MSIQIPPACTHPAPWPGRDGEEAARLQLRRRQIQDQLLLVRAAGTDSAGALDGMQRELETDLEEISHKLRTAGAACVSAEETLPPSTTPKAPDLDRYEPGSTRPSPGIYEGKREGRGGYRFSFLPCSEP